MIQSMDDEDDYFDTVSLNSTVNRRRLNSKEYFGLSHNTLYHSAIELEGMEMTTMDGSCADNKRWKNFTHSDLSVDFVLAYNERGSKNDIEKRRVFETNLENAGLNLEREENQRIHFVKLNAPQKVLIRYAEILKLRFPIRETEEDLPRDNVVISTVNRLLDKLNITLDPQQFPKKKYQLTAEFSKDKDYLFDMNAPNFFDTLTKVTVISYILERERFGEDDQDKGIKRLIAEGVYKAAYPLHDGDVDDNVSKRSLLFHEWASVSKCIKFQPLDEIKDYFGVKFALYFTWLGFYTHMLIPAAIVGIVCLIYAVTTVQNDTVSRDICNLDITMCPRCDKYCDYWKLSEGCTYSKIQHLIDNPATIFFSVFMSFWGTLYLELWKRYSADITHRWGLTGFDLQAEPPRPEYLTRLTKAKKRKLNVITQLQEPVVPFWRVKLPSLILSFTIAIFWTLIALGVVLGVVVYRMSLVMTDALYHDKASYRIYIIPITAGLINLLCIVILNMIYNRLAEWLTEMELQRTQTEFDDSLALKIYMFQFVNYYSSIFYIAFLKGKFVGYPAKYNTVFGYRQEECNPGGCLMELTIQLAIIMIGNQAVNTILEMVIPVLMKMYKTFVVSTGLEKPVESDEEMLISCNQWTEDYKLSDLESRSLFSEYLEMVLQYGFVTIFVTAFPLAPLFALINNVLEMRLDAKKFIKYYRRPIPIRVKNIGVWFPILAIVGRIAVVSNAFIIAFSSHFIPKMVYLLKVNPEHTEDGFLEHTLAYFNTSDFSPMTAPQASIYNISMCRYAEYRNPPDHPDKYKRPLIYWHILTARLAFIVVYQNLVSFVMTAVEWMIPDVSRKLNDRIKREAYKINEIIIKNETERAKTKNGNLRKRESVVSGITIYHDANGDLLDDVPSNRSTVYYESGDR